MRTRSSFRACWPDGKSGRGFGTPDERKQGFPATGGAECRTGIRYLGKKKQLQLDTRLWLAKIKSFRLRPFSRGRGQGGAVIGPSLVIKTALIKERIEIFRNNIRARKCRPNGLIKSTLPLSLLDIECN